MAATKLFLVRTATSCLCNGIESIWGWMTTDKIHLSLGSWYVGINFHWLTASDNCLWPQSTRSSAWLHLKWAPMMKFCFSSSSSSWLSREFSSVLPYSPSNMLWKKNQVSAFQTYHMKWYKKNQVSALHKYHMICYEKFE